MCTQLTGIRGSHCAGLGRGRATEPHFSQVPTPREVAGAGPGFARAKFRTSGSQTAVINSAGTSRSLGVALSILSPRLPPGQLKENAGVGGGVENAEPVSSEYLNFPGDSTNTQDRALSWMMRVSPARGSWRPSAQHPAHHGRCAPLTSLLASRYLGCPVH